MAKKKKAEAKAAPAKAPLRGLLDTPTNCNSYIVHDPDHELAMKVTDGSVDGVWLDGEELGGGGGNLVLWTIKITNNTEDTVRLTDGCYYVEDGAWPGQSNWAYPDATTDIIVIAGPADAEYGVAMNIDGDYTSYTLSGNIEDVGEGAISVSGDGTITVS